MTLDDKHVTHLIVGLDAGGAELALYRLAQEQMQQGWTVQIIYLKSSANAIVPDFEACNIPVMHIGTVPQIAESIKKVLKNKRPHILHSHLFYADSLAWMLKGLLGIPWVTTLHSTFDFHTGNASRSAISKRLYPRADALFAVSDEVAQSFQNACNLENVAVIANPVSKEFFETTTPKNDTKTKKLLQIGRLAPEKRFEWGIKAMLELPADYHLTIAGTGPLEIELQALTKDLQLSDRVTFTGLQKNPLALYLEADCVLLPSSHEGLPLVALEAIATQTPILAQPVGGLHSLLEKSPIPAQHMQNETDLALAIKTLMDAPIQLEAWNKWSAQARDQFAAKSIAVNYIHHYQVVLDSHNQRDT